MLDSVTRKEIEVILNSTHDAMIAVDSKGIVNIFNKAAEELTGLKARDVIGRLAKDVISNTRLHVVLETGEAELNQQQELGDTTIITNRVPVIDDEGNIQGAVAVFRDITEIKELARQITDLREVRSLLEAIIASTQDAISVVDEKGRGILFNPAYTKITGLSPEEVLNKPATVDIAEGESMHMKVLRTREPVRGVRMKVGPAKKDVVVNVAPIIVNGRLKGSVGVIHDISEIRKLTRELEDAKRLIRRLAAKYTFDDIIGQSEEIIAAKDQANRAAMTPATVLLRGESGTGKELFAHAIHNASNRAKAKFVRVNCAAIPENLLESELFGYEEGAFTGALRGGRIGLFEEANGGTLFLDEIGEIDLGLQAKLLRVLQEKEIRRVGGTKPIPVDVRVIAATNASLEEKIREGTFREDLYYRLNVIPVFIPPLRRRSMDIPLLVDYLIKKFNQEFGRNVASMDKKAIEKLIDYSWPGNVRELENVIGRAIINMKYNEEIIRVNHLPPLNQDEKPMGLMDNTGGQDLFKMEDGRNLNEIIENFERELVRQAMEKAGGNKTRAAKILGISLRNLYYKLDKYRINN